MVVEIIVLALLDRGPRHGYEIKKEVEGILRRATRLNNNLLYPALRDLSARGLISPARTSTGERVRKVYMITEAGRSRLGELLADFGEPEAEREDEFLARLAFFDMVDAEDRLRIIGLRERALERKALHSRTLGDDYLPAFGSPWVREILSRRGAALQSELEWTRSLRRLAAKPTGTAKPGNAAKDGGR